LHDYSKLSDKPNYEEAALLAEELMDGFVSGKYDKVEIVYNHYKSTSSQPPMRETFLPLNVSSETMDAEDEPHAIPIYIVEPDINSVLQELLTKVLRLKVYTVLLDTAAAEHAARTVAMQTATDNGNDILQDLTLEYNKGRQQKITSEILDIVAGSQQ
jgi:F-type H+-transporting ATPase subunit gamma